MARPKNSAAPDLSLPADLTAGVIDRLQCPPDKQQAFLRDARAPGLKVRVTRAGSKAFVFESKLNRQTIRRTIGDVRAWTIEQARSEARRLAVAMDRRIDPREQERAQAAADAAAVAEKEAAPALTLRAMLLAYCDHLETLGRRSHADARSLFSGHVFAPWPRIAEQPARLTTDEQVADMMRRLHKAGKARTANKLRSYMRAAFQVAKSVRSDPKISETFKPFNITSNPAADTVPDSTANASAKNPLTADEMRAYWRAIRSVPGVRGACLRLHLLSGGQRIEQLVKLRTRDIKPALITLFDPKGRPGKPARVHPVPLVPLAEEALLSAHPEGEFALSTDGGKTHIHATTLSKWAQEAAKDARIAGFQAKRIRSGVETLLASRKVSREDRGRLQSHGIGGVQDTSYDAHDYMDEKRSALTLLCQVVTG